ncbi:MAG: 6-pyruvoyl-tetrahydropterin synthase-related protein, partial [Chloroflexota bacterium]
SSEGIIMPSDETIVNMACSEGHLTTQHTPTRDWGWLIAITLPLIGILPTFAGGIMAAADAPLHTHRIYAMGTLLAEGQLYPRWVPWFHLGYGYPIFNFYTPGVFYVGGLLTLLGFSAVTAFHLVAAAAWIFGSLGTYKLARTFLPASAAIVAAALWSYAPSRLFEVWTQGSLPQIACAAFVPWVFLTVARGANHPSPRKAVWIALAIAGLVFTHQPVTFITALFVAPFTVMVILWASHGDWRSLWRRMLCVYGGIALAAGLAMIFLLPLALELRLVEAVNGRDDVVRYLTSNFLLPPEVIAFPMPLDLTDIRVEYPMSLGLVGSVLFVFGIVAMLRRQQFVIAVLLVVATGFTIFMLLEPSLPVWLTIPYFQQIRFPARVLRVGAVLIALGGGASVLLFPHKLQLPAAYMVIALFVLTKLPFVYPSQPILDYREQSATAEMRFEAETYTWGTTSYNEFNPQWGDRTPYDLPPEVNDYATNPTQIYPYDRVDGFELIDANTFTVTTREARPVRIRQFYYPGWQVRLNGEPADIYPGDDVGMITVDVPEGTHEIEVRYRGTWAQRIGTALTLASGVIALGLLRVSGPAREPAPSGDNLRMALLPTMVPAVLLTGFSVLNYTYIEPQTNWFRLQSPPNDPAYMQTEQYVPFGDDIALMGYTLNDTVISQRETLPITLYWLPLRDLVDTHYRPIVQIVNLSVTEQWAVSQPFFPGGGFTSTYTTEQFSSDPHDLRLFDYAQPHAARIMVQMVDAETGEPLLLPDGSDRVLLDTFIHVDLPQPHVMKRLDYVFNNELSLRCRTITEGDETLEITLYWHAERPISADYTTFVHGLDDTGNIVEQADRPPIPDYPTSLWRRGQTLETVYTLPANDDIELIAVGLYDESGRIPVREGSEILPDDRVVLPMLESECIRER